MGFADRQIRFPVFLLLARLTACNHALARRFHKPHLAFQLSHLAFESAAKPSASNGNAGPPVPGERGLFVHDSGFFSQLSGRVFDCFNAVVEFVQFQALLLVFCAQALVFNFSAQVCGLLRYAVKAVKRTTKNG